MGLNGYDRNVCKSATNEVCMYDGVASENVKYTQYFSDTMANNGKWSRRVKSIVQKSPIRIMNSYIGDFSEDCMR